jgi:hypothetical protein
MDERRGAAQRFDRPQASLPDRLCYFSITSSSTWDIDDDMMDVILNNQQILVAHC